MPQIGGIATAAATGLGVLDADHATARQLMSSIERDGRNVLDHMRETLGALQERAPGEPQPTPGAAARTARQEHDCLGPADGRRQRAHPFGRA